jgi:hypothetical protein
MFGGIWNPLNWGNSETWTNHENYWDPVGFVSGRGSDSSNFDPTGAAAARAAQRDTYREGIGAIGDYYGLGQQGIAGPMGWGQNALSTGYASARDAFGSGMDQARQDMLGGYGAAQAALGGAGQALSQQYGQGQAALGAGLEGGLGQLGMGYGMGRQTLDPYIGSDLAARGAYQNQLLGTLTGDNPYWDRMRAQGTEAMNRNLEAQGLLGSSAAARAGADLEAQIQLGREQEFFGRAQGLFNPAAAQQAAGMGMQTGMAGAGMFGDVGRASAGMYGQLGQGLAGIGGTSAGMYGQQAQGLGQLGAQGAGGFAGLWADEAGRRSGLYGQEAGLGAGLAGAGMGSIGQMYGGLANSYGRGWMADLPLNFVVGA